MKSSSSTFSLVTVHLMSYLRSYCLAQDHLDLYLLHRFTPMFSSKSSFFAFSYILLEVNFYVWCQEGVQFHSFASGCIVIAASFFEKTSFPIELSWHPCSQLNINVRVFFLNHLSVIYMFFHHLSSFSLTF